MTALYIRAGWIGLSASYICLVEVFDTIKHRRALRRAQEREIEASARIEQVCRMRRGGL